jgi:hypothetical protein
MSSNLISSFNNVYISKMNYIKKTTYNKIFNSVLFKKIIIILISLFIVLFINIFFFNQLLMIILEPLIQINFENLDQSNTNRTFLLKNIHLIYDIIENDSLFENSNNSIFFTHIDNNKSFEYLPCFEINLNMQNTSNLYWFIIILSTIYYSIPYIIYQLYIVNHPIKKSIFLKFIFLYLNSQLICIKIVLPFIYKITMHNYQEYIYFEFDIGFDFFQIIFIYYKILYYITFNIYIFMFTTSKNIFLLSTLLNLLTIYIFVDDIMILLIFLICNILIFFFKKINIIVYYYINFFKKKINIYKDLLD